MRHDGWQALAARQGGLLTRAQLAACGIDRWVIRNRVSSGRWVLRSATVVGTTTGELTREQELWRAALHAGPRALVAGLTAAEEIGLRNWHRDTITVLVPYENAVVERLPGVDYVRTRRPLHTFRLTTRELPLCRIEPAVLLWAATERHPRTAQGVLAATVQQHLSTPAILREWIDRLAPLRKAPLFRAALAEMEGGAQSLAEIDVRRLCRRYRIAAPRRQVRRRDAEGRLRFTDCEWSLPDGRTLVLEVDGSFHMDVANWEDDLARQRALSATDRVIIRCTSRELRDEPGNVARDLIAIGVPRGPCDSESAS